MKKLSLMLAIAALVFGGWTRTADAKKPKPVVINNITEVTNVTNNTTTIVEAADAHNVLGVKVDAPNLVKIGKGWTLGAEGGKDIMKDVFYDSDYYEADRGYFAYVKVTYSGCLLNCEE